MAGSHRCRTGTPRLTVALEDSSSACGEGGATIAQTRGSPRFQASRHSGLEVQQWRRMSAAPTLQAIEDAEPRSLVRRRARYYPYCRLH